MGTENFEVVPFPCTECLVQAACTDKPKTSKDIYSICLLIPKWDESCKIYRKGLIECWVNMGLTILQNQRDFTHEGMPQESSPTFNEALFEIVQLLQYIINSTSWRMGERYDFDIEEMQTQVRKISHWIKAKR